MPLSPWEALQRGEISSEELKIPAQSLAGDETDAFLDFMFSNLARRHTPLSLQEGAALAHYLLALSRELPDRRDRGRMLREAQLLWRTLFTAPWKASSKAAARRFLRRHEEGGLGAVDVAWLRSLVEELPAPAVEERNAPQMASRQMAVYGEVNPHLRDDLSERIYAAYYALVGNGIKNARGRIAEALNAKKLYPRPTGGLKGWDGDHVINRVRQFEKRSTPGDEQRRSADVRKLRRSQTASFWIYRFREPSK